jgi:adenylosuccinate lyase
MVQRNALKVCEDRTDFREELLADEQVVTALGGDQRQFQPRLSPETLDTILPRFGADT